jgi:hypothetical protein
MTSKDWFVIIAAAAIGYGAVSFFLGRRTRPPQSPPTPAPATREDPSPYAASAPPADPSRSAWDQMHDRPAPGAPPKH